MIALYRLLAFLAFVGLWWIASLVAGPNLVPTPWATAQAGWTLIQQGRVQAALWQSLSVYLTGYGLSIVIGIPLGLLMGGIRPLGRTLDLYVNALMATPRVAFIPLIIVFLGIGFQAKVMVILLGAVMPIIINTYAGVMNADDELIEMARSAGASRRQIFLRIMLPGAVPFIVAGLRLGATIGLINTIVAELYTAVTGLGGLIATYGRSFRMAQYFFVILVLAAVGVIVTQALRFLELRLTRWRGDRA